MLTDPTESTDGAQRYIGPDDWRNVRRAFDGDPGVRPQGHIFVGSKACWYAITDDLPQHEEYPPEFAMGGVTRREPQISLREQLTGWAFALPFVI